MNDKDLIEEARREGRAIATADLRDFRPLAAADLLAGGSHPGLILIAGERALRLAEIGPTVARLAAMMDDHPDELALLNQEVWL